VTDIYEENVFLIDRKQYFAQFETEVNSLEYMLAESRLYRMEEYSKLKYEYNLNIANGEELP
jgi:hypothetical protein